MECNTDIFGQFDKKWALLTCGTPEKFNSMTVSWGGMGTLSGKPVATVYVRTSRYTHEFMDDNDYFTVSFYPESCRPILNVFGAKSGRDIDKMHYEGLTVKPVGEDPAGNAVTFEEAEVTLLCRKMCRQRIEAENIPEEAFKTYYEGDALHDMYIGEVVEIIG